MGVLERALEWLRPLVESDWDYCVVWKLGDDPSRYIEWMSCCCSGTKGVYLKVKKEDCVETQKFTFCKDVHIQHPISTSACEALSRLPSSMPLYSGIHGEVVISNQPKWLTSASKSDWQLSDVSTGTRVLVPVLGGLIELYNAKQIYKDQEVINFILSQFKATSEAVTKHFPDQLLAEYTSIRQSPMYSIGSNSRVLSQVSEMGSNLSLQGISSTGSTPGNENPLCDSISDHGPANIFLEQTKLRSTINTAASQRESNLNFNSKTCVVERNVQQIGQRKRKGPYQSKNLHTERNRRSRIKGGLYALRALVPNITKMNKTAILGDAIDYIEELKAKVEELQAEIKELDKESDSKKRSDSEKHGMKQSRESIGYSPASDHDPNFSTTTSKVQMEMQVDITKIGAKGFLVKFFGRQQNGVFTWLLEVMNSLGLQIREVNLTSCKGVFFCLLTVEGNADGIQEAVKLKGSLAQL